MDLLAAAKELAPRFQERRRWFIACDADADGLAAAAVMAKALTRQGHQYTIRASRDKTSSFYQSVLDEEHILFLDKGTSHVHAMHPGCIVIDHHNIVDPPAPGVQILNPRLVGLDGSKDACSSTSAFALAIAMDQRNWDLAGVALAGAIGDWQHHGGWRGWNEFIVQEGVKRAVLREVSLPRLVGVDLADAVSRMGLPNRDDEAAAALLAELEIPIHKEVEDLDVEERSKLMSRLAHMHLHAGSPSARIEKLVMQSLWHPTLDTSLRRVFRVSDACGRQGRGGLGVAYLLGDKSARTEAEEQFQSYQAALVKALGKLRADGTIALQAIQYAWTEDPAYTGMVAGIGMTQFLETEFPVCILAKRGDKVQVSTRALPEHVARGINLGIAVQASAIRVGKEGGGHPIAAGAVLHADDVPAFLDALDENLLAQGDDSEE